MQKDNTNPSDSGFSASSYITFPPAADSSRPMIDSFCSLKFFSPRPPVQVLEHMHVRTDSHWNAAVRPMPAYQLIYTEKGTGNLRFIKQSDLSEEYRLSENSILFIPPYSSFLLHSLSDNWTYHTIFLEGPTVDYYFTCYCQFTESLTSSFKTSCLFLEKAVSSSAAFLNLCAELPSCADDSLCQLHMAAELLHTLISEKKEHEKEDCSLPIRSYLLSIQKQMQKNYASRITLDDLEASFQISKFRISREFTAAFGMPPISYLNRIRLEKARELLLHTENRVNEVGSVVGFDNTNHFIRLFKRQYGTTPGEYKKYISQKTK